MVNALEIKNLSKSFKSFSLENVNITLPAGCIMGFIGENGAGKSTTIKLALDLMRPDSGEVKILGQHYRDNRALKEHVGAVLDETSFLDCLTTKNICEIMSKTFKTFSYEKFNKFCDDFQLPSNRAVREFSRGMKMKLSIAAALSHDTTLLILDEATSGLDPIVRDEILDVFYDFIQDESHGIFMSSHILSDLEKICDYICFIHNGRILFCEPKDSLLSKYAVLKCGAEEYSKLDPSIVVGARKHQFGVEALICRGKSCPPDAEPATIEDIMLYFVKEK